VDQKDPSTVTLFGPTGFAVVPICFECKSKLMELAQTPQPGSMPHVRVREPMSLSQLIGLAIAPGAIVALALNHPGLNQLFVGGALLLSAGLITWLCDELVYAGLIKASRSELAARRNR